MEEDTILAEMTIFMEMEEVATARNHIMDLVATMITFMETMEVAAAKKHIMNPVVMMVEATRIAHIPTQMIIVSGPL